MATYTTNYNLKKPGYADAADVADFNGNFDTIDTELASKTEKFEYTATVTTNWVGASAPYTQEVTVNGITADDTIELGVVYSADNATAILENTAWNLVKKVIPSANKLTFTCFETKPVTAFTLSVTVFR